MKEKIYNVYVIDAIQWKVEWQTERCEQCLGGFYKYKKIELKMGLNPSKQNMTKELSIIHQTKIETLEKVYKILSKIKKDSKWGEVKGDISKELDKITNIRRNKN